MLSPAKAGQQKSVVASICTVVFPLVKLKQYPPIEVIMKIKLHVITDVKHAGIMVYWNSRSQNFQIIRYRRWCWKQMSVLFISRIY